ncbi:MAG: hypothetical protein Q7U89_03725 [Coriobacteriia bacterium]|nr:hypothetical protein [Coriobacteriia bacterium]
MKNRRLLIMFAIVLVDMLSFSIVLPLLPYLAGDLSASAAQISLIGAAFGMGFILGPVTGGLLSGISFALPAWVGAGLALTNALVVIFLLPESLSAHDKSRLRDRPGGVSWTRGVWPRHSRTNAWGRFWPCAPRLVSVSRSLRRASRAFRRR